MFDAAQAAGIIAGLGVAVFAIIAFTPSDEFAIVVGAALQVIGYGGAVIGVVNNLYKLSDFAIRVDKARTEQELKTAGDIFAEAVVGLGIDVLFSVLGKLGSWFKGKGSRRTPKVDDVLRDGNHFDELGKLKPNVRYKAGEFEYIYKTDDLGRLKEWNTDNLQLTKRDTRLHHNPNSPGKLQGDQAGHLAGDRFGGSPELDNIVSQLTNVNKSKYSKLEYQWAKALNDIPPKKVTVNVDIKYDGDGLRPIEFNVRYTIDGKLYSSDIPNY